jgi:hypothetical protein
MVPASDVCSALYDEWAVSVMTVSNPKPPVAVPLLSNCV